MQWEKISTSGPLPLISASPKSFLCHRVLEVNGCLFSFGGMHGIGDNHFSYVSILSTPMNHIHVASVDTESVIDSHSISSLGAPRLAAAEVLIRNLSYYGGSNADKWIWLAHQPEDESLLLYPTTTEGSFRLLYHNKLPSTIMEGVPQTHLNLASVQSILIVPVDICLGNYRSSLQSDLLRLFDRAQCEGQSPGDYDIQFLVESFTETDSMHEPLDGNLSANNSIDEGQSSLNVETSSPLTFTPMVVRAHKELLKRRCAYWRAVFDSSMSESRELEVRVRVEQPSAFYAFIRYLYTGQLAIFY